MVISTKYPAWMVAHGTTSCTCSTRCAGSTTRIPPHLPRVPADVPRFGRAALVAAASRPDLDRSALPDLFGQLESLRIDDADRRRRQGEARWHFPGRSRARVVHALDRVGLAPRRGASVFRDLENRGAARGLLPAGRGGRGRAASARPRGFPRGAGEFIFTASRLDGAKRIDLLIRAYRRCRTDAPLVIAGEGPAGDTLRALAAGDPRIRFVGRLTDDDTAVALRPRALRRVRSVPGGHGAHHARSDEVGQAGAHRRAMRAVSRNSCAMASMVAWCAPDADSLASSDRHA